ncbi:MAG TPA: hypothetical protein VK718_06185 [Ferruginibacter sp.]|jgi:hypothetical protein|nr:hypothetical protein [Ferruginibacter sp.]
MKKLLIITILSGILLFSCKKSATSNSQSNSHKDWTINGNSYDSTLLNGSNGWWDPSGGTNPGIFYYAEGEDAAGDITEVNLWFLHKPTVTRTYALNGADEVPSYDSICNLAVLKIDGTGDYWIYTANSIKQTITIAVNSNGNISCVFPTLQMTSSNLPATTFFGSIAQ